ncbi:MAG: hypothetical protein QM808_06805 [Steroidobacteraceae bacterium]
MAATLDELLELIELLRLEAEKLELEVVALLELAELFELVLPPPHAVSVANVTVVSSEANKSKPRRDLAVKESPAMMISQSS